MHFIIITCLGIKRSSYEATIGVKMKMWLASSIIPKNILPKLQTEKNSEVVLTETNGNSIEDR